MSLLGFSLLGGGGLLGAGAVALRIFAPGLFTVIETGAVKIAQAIPPKAWLAIGAVALLITGYFVHGHYAEKARAAAYAAGAATEDAKWQKRLAAAHAAAIADRQKTETVQANISKADRNQNAKDLHDIGARADDQRLRGPGQAAAQADSGQGGHPVIPGAAGGHEPPGGAVAPGLSGLPAEPGLAVVPWDDLVAFGAICDANRAEALTWRKWHGEQAEANRKEREADAKSSPPPDSKGTVK